MDKVIFNAQIRDQKLHIIHRSKFDQFIAGCGWNQVEIIIRKKRKRRSLSQNAYLFSTVYPYIQDGIKESWGYPLSKDEVHSLMKQYFCYKEIVNPTTGEVTKIPDHTSELSTTDFMLYITQLQEFAKEFLGVTIPEPNTQQEMF